ncbi:MAG: type 4a pilus biogenesis protein PilO, partial [Patescibacteria group bacterium]
IENVNRLAIESGVNLVSIMPQQRETDENLNKLVLRMEARCGYHELGKFFSGIESGARLIKISNVSVQSQAAPQGIEKKLTVAMSLTAYYPRQNTPA